MATTLNVSADLAAIAGKNVRGAPWIVILCSTWFIVLSGTILLLQLVRDLVRTSNLKLPPGPHNLPIIGGLHHLAPEVHKSFAGLAKKYGPIFYIRFGLHPVVVISSPAVAKELCTQKDLAFASRPNASVQGTPSKYLGFDSEDIGAATYTPSCRFLRKLVTEEFFTGAKVNASFKHRQDELFSMLRSIAAASEKGETIDIDTTSHVLMTNVLCRLIFGKRLYGNNVPLEGEWKNFKQMAREQTTVAAKFNLADLHPVLGWVSSKSVLKECQEWNRKAYAVFSGLIEDHREERRSRGGAENVNKDFVHSMLSIQEKEPSKLSENNMMGVLSDLFIGGNDSTAGAIVWALLELMRSPKCLAKLREELDRVVGKDRLMEDSDVANLPYLQAVVKETFRLHNPLPMLLARTNETQQILGGYDIPANSTLFVNTYAITHDPAVYEKPFSYNPERFMELSEVGLQGNNFELIPFGSGRRMCVGISLALTIMHTSLGNLVQAFDWLPRPGTTIADISNEEIYGINIKNKYPLVLSAVPRISFSLYASTTQDEAPALLRT